MTKIRRINRKEIEKKIVYFTIKTDYIAHRMFGYYVALPNAYYFC